MRSASPGAELSSRPFGRGVLVTLHQSGFVRLTAPEPLSLCVLKEKVAKEKEHPGWRLSGILPGKCVRRGRAFRAGLLPAQKGEVHPWTRPLRGLLVPASPPHRGPGRAGAHRARQKPKRGELAALRFALAVASARRERAALPGAPMARRVGEGKSAGWLAWMRASFSPAQDVPSKNPVAHPRTQKAGCLEGAPSGCPSLWLLSLGQARESNSGAVRRSKPL